ncbi:DEAD/DEAH box helicase family protein [Catenuloplanes japonicus]|uniref:DEAD/DEAH box helicase family protein n=1 Tax=Catenuloplanes japonicus TaxID=33876 RepID=UPI00068C3F2B|nr:DEAD/DEAH box helicase family protein [Catenuloplanes japonicus]
MTDWLPYDPDLVAQIAAAMDLRAPNAGALAAAARAVAPGDGGEAVCELATGVGKSYVSAALVAYLAERGVRNILIVTPGTAVHEKTVGNFTPGHPRYVPGGEWTPVIVTGRARGPAPPPDALTLYVFTVQQLIRPGASASRRLRAPDEALGAGLYQRLAETSDLVVIADEHHVYRQAARAFAAAVRDLAPRALIGFTATPDRADRARVVFRYPLASAITDGLVAVPVLVGASAPGQDREARLRDACRLRAAKESAWLAWARAHGVPPVTPLIFVVCRAIDEAGEVADELAGLLPGAGRVLLVTSRSGDDALRALARVDEPSSPVRAVVAVDKLNSGWDVPNVGVILALRALASETLTEQILGRGLRLAYGRRAGVAAVDSIDVLTHESYRTLLESTDALREALAPGSAGRTAPDGDGDGVTLTIGAAPLLRISGYARALAAAREPVEVVPAGADEPPVPPFTLPATRFSLAAVPDEAAREAGALEAGAWETGAREVAVRDLAARILALPLVEAVRTEMAEADRLAAAYLSGVAASSASPGGLPGSSRTPDGLPWDTATAERAADVLAALIAATYHRVNRASGTSF